MAVYFPLSWVTPPSMILQGDWFCAVWYCGEINSGQYDTVRRFLQTNFINSGEILTKIENILTHWSVAQVRIMKKLEVKHLIGMSLLRGSGKVTWLPSVWYCGEIDSAQYDTPGRFRKIWIARQNLNQNQKYVEPFWSVAQAISIYAKTWGSRWTFPLRLTLVLQYYILKIKNIFLKYNTKYVRYTVIHITVLLYYTK